MPRPLRLLLVSALLASACVFRSGTSQYGHFETYFAGRWEASPPLGGPSPPGSSLSTIDIVIERVARDNSDEGWPDGPVAWGTVIMDGTPWPMTFELRGPADSLWEYCRFAAGHPFRQSPDPDGFRFTLVLHDPPQRSDQDALFIDWYQSASRDGSGLESDWCRYERRS